MVANLGPDLDVNSLRITLGREDSHHRSVGYATPSATASEDPSSHESSAPVGTM
jgi:hypothetical protein